MVFCNLTVDCFINELLNCHNPYFSRWFSAIIKYRWIKGRNTGHNPYFSRWFSAIKVTYGRDG